MSIVAGVQFCQRAMGVRRVVSDDRPTAEELEHLYSSLGAEERDDLLQEILVAWATGEEAMAAVVDVWLLDHAARAFIDEIAGGEA